MQRRKTMNEEGRIFITIFELIVVIWGGYMIYQTEKEQNKKQTN